MTREPSHNQHYEKEDIRPLLFHVNTVFHTRTNLLLVAEAIFFAAIASLWGEGNRSIKLIVCGLGAILTIVLWLANSSLKARMDLLTTRLEEADDLYKEYLKEKPLYVSSMLTNILPLIFLVAWVLIAAILFR